MVDGGVSRFRNDGVQGWECDEAEGQWSEGIVM